MKRLHINLATPSRATPMMLWLLKGVLWASAASGAWLAWAAAQEARNLSDEVAALRAMQARPQTNAAPPAPYAADAQALLRLAEADIGHVLVVIESAAVPGVRISRLELDAQTRRVTLEIDAPDHLLALLLFEHLQAQSSMLNWRVERSQANANVRVQMLVSGGW